jgi:hypothetical protein
MRYRSSIGRGRGIAAVLSVLVLGSTMSAAQEITVPNGGFESGLVKPWGTGSLASSAVWWNSGGCKSTASADPSVRHGGTLSLHVVNASHRGPNVFGCTQQPIIVPVGRPIRISLFARARDLRSNGAVSIVVDSEWKIRPIQLPKGTWDWTRFSGEFTPNGAAAELRILSEDSGEAWIDEIRMEVVEAPGSLPKGLEGVEGLARRVGAPVVAAIGPNASTVPLAGGARFVVPAGAIPRPAKLTVTIVDLELQQLALDVGRSVAYEVSTDVDLGPLAAPVFLEIPSPTAGTSIVERDGTAWKRRAIPPGEVTRIPFEHFSTHLLAHLFWVDFGNASSVVLSRVESRMANWVGTRADRYSTLARLKRELIENSDEWTRKFYGVGETTTKPHDATCEELRRVLAHYARAGKLALPGDSPWTNEELYEYLIAAGLPSANGRSFYPRVAKSQEVITAKVLDSKEPVSPAALLRIAIEAHRGDIPLGILAAQTWTKQLTNAGRAFPNDAAANVPKDLGAAAAKLETWRRSEPIDPAGSYDKLGPIYHLFSAMTAGVWGGTHFDRFAIAGESILRSTGLTDDHPDPEKGEADVCGASVAQWVNAGLPGADAILPKDEPPYLPPPNLWITGKGRWTAVGRKGGGTISLSIDLKRRTFGGAIMGTYDGTGGFAVAATGRIDGNFEGNDAGGRLTATGPAGRKPDRLDSLSVLHGSDAFKADYVGSKVMGTITLNGVTLQFSFPVDLVPF